MNLSRFPLYPRRTLFQFIAWTLVLWTPLFAGEEIPFAEKVFSADVIIEVELRFLKPIPRNWPNDVFDPQGWGFPDQLIGEAKRDATIGRILYTKADTIHLSLPGSIFIFSSNSPCWWKAHKRKSLRALVFFTRESDGSLKQACGVEQETGQYSDLNPQYEELVSAIQTSRSWQEERKRAVEPEMVWKEQQQILTESPNIYLVELAQVFLREHDARSTREYWNNERKQAHTKAFLARIHSMVCR